MPTLVSFHAHPDDEAIASGGSLARAAAEGHRVVVVFATRGELGEVPDGFLDPGEVLADRREAESQSAAEIFGVHRVEFLGYHDSGMMGEPTNDDPQCFWQADVAAAAERLAAILRQESADVLTIYDEIGNYGHPDHIQVHRVGLRAGELASTPRVYELTMSREHVMQLMQEWSDAPPAELPDVDPAAFGSPEEVITTRVDVVAYLDVKRKGMAAHASQVAETSFFLAQPPDRFARLWGTEWYIRRGAPAETRESWLFEDEPT